MGHVLSISFTLMSGAKTTRLDTTFRQEVDAMMDLIKTNHVTERERKHVEAIKLWSDGYFDTAAFILEEILTEHPLDLLAVVLAYEIYYNMGRAAEMRDLIARILPYWTEEDTPMIYCYLLSGYSFGLGETNRYAEAKRVARKGLTLNRYHHSCVHSLIHALETLGRVDEVVQLIEATLAGPGGKMTCHIYWHLAICYVEKGDYNEALHLFDSQMQMAPHAKSNADMTNSSCLLYRLEMEGVGVGAERWEAVYERCRPHLDGHIFIYNDLHMLMACLGAKKYDVVRTFMTSLKQFVQSESGTNQANTKEFGVAVAEALIAYDDGEYARAVELTNRVRYQLYKMGGSNNARDTFHLFLVHAALRSNTPIHHKLARNLIYERMAARPKSQLNKRLLRKIAVQP